MNNAKNPLQSSWSQLVSAPMAKSKGTAKTRKAVAKRFKVTGTGKILRRKQGKRHILTKKSQKRKRALGKATLVSKADLKAVRASLPFA